MNFQLVFILNFLIMTTLTAQINKTVADNTKKSVLARGCDPVLSQNFARTVPPLIGNAEYVATTNDVEFIEQLKTRKWSVIYFAPGACRFSAAKSNIPGASIQTTGWTIEDYVKLINELQGNDIQIAQSAYESESLKALQHALEKARNIK